MRMGSTVAGKAEVVVFSLNCIIELMAGFDWDYDCIVSAVASL